MLGREDPCGWDCSQCLILPRLPCVSSNVEMDAEMDTEMVLLVYVVGIIVGVYPFHLFLDVYSNAYT